MSDIRVILDPDAEGNPAETDIIVGTLDDVLALRAHLREIVEPDARVTIWIRSPALLSSLEDLKNDPNVRIEVHDPAAELSNVLGLTSLPALIDQRLIRETGLLQMAHSIPRHEDESGLSWCLRVQLNERWSKRTVSAGDLTHLVNDTIVAEPILEELVKWRLSTWARSSEHGQLLRWLADDPHRKAACLAACAAVRGYGAAAIQWLTQCGYEPALVKTGMELLDELRCGEPIRPRSIYGVLEHQMQRELTRRLSEHGPSAVQAAVSGSDAEARVVLQYLLDEAEVGHLLAEKDSRQLVAWAEQCSDAPVALQVAFAAELLEEKALPEQLEETADWASASHWLENEYLPAYLCRALSNRLDETAEAVAGFEDWLCTTYRTLMEETEAGLHWFCARGRAIIEDAVVVLVLVDGAPYPAMRWLREELALEEALSVESERPYLSPIPTLTSIGKPAILSARLPDQAASTETAALSEVFGKGPESHRIVDRLEDIGVLLPGQILFHHCKNVDRDLLHRPMTSAERWLQVYLFVRDIAARLRSLVQRALSQGVPIWLGCVSDHGWTELPMSSKRVGIPDGLEQYVTHRRTITGTADSRYGIAVPGTEFFLNDDFTVGRGYSHFVRRPHGAVHGGITPQEISVGGIWATTATIRSTTDLILHVAGEVRRAVRDNRISLQINNPNLEAVSVSAINLDAIEIRSGALPLSIDRDAVSKLAALCDATGCSDMLALKGEIHWQTASGRRKRQVVDFSVPTVGAASTDRAFEDMFGR